MRSRVLAGAEVLKPSGALDGRAGRIGFKLTPESSQKRNVPTGWVGGPLVSVLLFLGNCTAVPLRSRLAPWREHGRDVADRPPLPP